jgi:hypothetical protein
MYLHGVFKMTTTHTISGTRFRKKGDLDQASWKEAEKLALESVGAVGELVRNLRTAKNLVSYQKVV